VLPFLDCFDRIDCFVWDCFLLIFDCFDLDRHGINPSRPVAAGKLIISYAQSIASQKSSSYLHSQLHKTQTTNKMVYFMSMMPSMLAAVMLVMSQQSGVKLPPPSISVPAQALLSWAVPL